MRLLELALLRILNEKLAAGQSTEFHVRALCALFEHKRLSMQDICEITELDDSIMLPVMKELKKEGLISGSRKNVFRPKASINTVFDLIQSNGFRKPEHQTKAGAKPTAGQKNSFK
jgi:hypothetical protein